MVIVGGGDGSLSYTVDEVVDRDCVFALLPLGTANSFARTLGIPLDLDGAIDVIATGQRRRIDLGMINDDYFANCAAMGLSPMIGEGVPHNLKRYLGRVGYLIWAVWCLIRFHAFRLTVRGEGIDETFWATEVRIANGGHHGGVELIESAEVDSGQIVVQAVVGRRGLEPDLGLVRQIFQASGPPPDDPRVPRRRAHHRDPAAPAHLDRRRGAGEDSRSSPRSPNARSRWWCRPDCSPSLKGRGWGWVGERSEPSC